MQEITIKTKILLDKLEGHKKIKKNLLKLIDDYKADSLKHKDSYYDDLIEKLDWNNSRTLERPWVQVLLPFIKKHFIKCTKKLNLKDFYIRALWFQQYGNQGTHGWHIHANNFTGVYYLEFDNHQYTQLLDPLNLNQAISLKVIEGDFIVFPSHVIHRSGVNKTNKKRSIISFNFDVKDIREDLLKERIIKYVH